MMARPAIAIRTIALRCRPSEGSNRNPTARLPITAPMVLARYRMPARRPTACSACWMTALASGKLTPISTAGIATSRRIGLALNHNSVTALAARSGAASDEPPSTLTSVSIAVHVCERQPCQRRRHQRSLAHHEPRRRITAAPQDRAAKQRPGADTHQDDGQQQREHRAEAAQQEAEMAEPQDLHAERGETR